MRQGKLIVYICFMLAFKSADSSASEQTFDTIAQRARALNTYAKKAKESTGTEQEKYLTLLFNALPNDFGTFFELIYGDAALVGGKYYDDILSSNIHSYNPWSNFKPFKKKEDFCPHNQELDDLYDLGFPRISALRKVIPEEAYYQKMISMGIGGVWEADCIGFLQGHLQGIVRENLFLSMRILAEKSAREVAAFWFFFYDGPHPDHPFYQELYDTLYPEINELNPTVARLMQEAREQVLLEEHCPGH